MKYAVSMLVSAVLLASCSQSDLVVDQGPSETDTTTTTVATPDGGDDGGDGGDVVTNGETTTTTDSPTTASEGANSTASEGSGDPSGEGTDAEGSTGDVPVGVGDASIDDAPAFVLDEDSENAAVFSELAAAGLVLSLDEQACADETATAAVDAGSSELDAVIGAVQECATPAAIDNFSAGLIVAGGAPLPPTEAACVSSRLQSGEEYQPFWAALVEEEPFDFLIADNDVQNRFLELYTECVSVGRAVGEQASVALSAPTVGCIDGLYADREFVRVTIEADLSGNAEDQARVNDQIAGCLTSEERSGLGLE